MGIVRNRSGLAQQDQNVNIPDNTSKLVNPLKHRTSNEDMVASAPNFLDDNFSINPDGAHEYTSDPTLLWDPSSIVHDQEVPNVRFTKLLIGSTFVPSLYFVAPSGTPDGQVGNIGRPFDLPTAITLAGSGDAIIFLAGNYGDIDYELAIGGVAYRTLGRAQLNIIDGGGFNYFNSICDIQGDLLVTINKTWDGGAFDDGFINITDNNTDLSHIVKLSQGDIVTGSHIVAYQFTNSESNLSIDLVGNSDDGKIIAALGNAGFALDFNVKATYTGSRDIQIVDVVTSSSSSSFAKADVFVESLTGGVIASGNCEIFGNINQDTNNDGTGASRFGSSGNEVQIYANLSGGEVQVANEDTFVNFNGTVTEVSITDPLNINGGKFRFNKVINNVTLGPTNNEAIELLNCTGSGLSLNSFNTTVLFKNCKIQEINLDGKSSGVRVFDSELTLADGTQIGTDSNVAINQASEFVNSTIEGNVSDGPDAPGTGGSTLVGSTLVLGIGSNANNPNLFIKIVNCKFVNNNQNDNATAFHHRQLRPHNTVLQNCEFISNGLNGCNIVNGSGTIKVIGDIACDPSFELSNPAFTGWVYGDETNFKFVTP